jgi:hypothetical protein
MLPVIRGEAWAVRRPAFEDEGMSSRPARGHGREHNRPRRKFNIAPRATFQAGAPAGEGPEPNSLWLPSAESASWRSSGSSR